MYCYYFRLCCILSFFCFLLNSCATLPENISGPKTYALQDTADTRIGKAYLSLKKGHPGDSGFLLLGKGLDAFAARMALAQGAEKSIDAQYYMIHGDLTGALFADQLIKAADRGVRVRLLIDDMDLEGRDEGLATLASHPNVFIKVFNPFSRNMFRGPQFVSGFGSVTRRMHNKSFTVDNQSTIVGGRNIGNEYFEANPSLAFADLDLLAIGPVVKEVSASFDLYWNHSESYPIKILRPDLAKEAGIQAGRQKLAESLAQNLAVEYLKSLHGSGLATMIKNGEVEFLWGQAAVLSDHPEKLESYDTDKNYSLITQFHPYWENLDRELLIFSPYFVPGKVGTDYLNNLSKKGVRVRILTNSLASTDVGLVHAGYSKYRRSLLRGGVELYELNKKRSKEQRKEKKGPFSSSKASLHAKSFVFDRHHVFIGSLNLDPRSITENTEIGIIVSSDDVANIMVEKFDMIVEKMAFRLELKTDNDGFEYISWHGLESGEKRVWTYDPYTCFWRRFSVGFMGLFPIESQL